MARATLQDGVYSLEAPEAVGDLTDFVTRVERQRGPCGIAVIGFDYPIGIPSSYAKLIECSNFLSFLSELNDDKWSNFFSVCDSRHEITHHRPFYPNNSLNRKQEHLLDALGIHKFDDLRRQCELKQLDRGAANPLFWTLGANQVGKGAIAGWKHVLCPALNDDSIRIWPFHGTLSELLQPGVTVVAETYPTQYHRLLFGAPFRGKGQQENRKSVGLRFLDQAALNGLLLTPALLETIHDGFPDGDDAFDAVVGLFGMLAVLSGDLSVEEPVDPMIQRIEGWILGQPLP